MRTEILFNQYGILKGLRPFSGVQRQRLWQGDSPQCGEMSAKLTEGTDRLGWDRVPHFSAGRFARGEFHNSPGDCFGRGDALQVKASPEKIRYYGRMTAAFPSAVTEGLRFFFMQLPHNIYPEGSSCAYFSVYCRIVRSGQREMVQSFVRLSTYCFNRVLKQLCKCTKFIPGT